MGWPAGQTAFQRSGEQCTVAEGAERDWYRATVAALVPRRGRRYEGDGDPLIRRGLPLPFTPPPGP